MLLVSPAAVAAIDILFAGADLGEGGGLRLTRGISDAEDPRTPIALTVVEEPEPGDEVVVASAAHPVFVEASTAELVSDQVLDAEVGDDRVMFRLEPQSTNGSAVT